MPTWDPIEGETPIADRSGLRLPHIRTRAQCNAAEAENIRGATIRYLAAPPSARLAPFTLPWLFTLHREMFGGVWEWAGQRRCGETNIGVFPHQIETSLQDMLDDLGAWKTHGMGWIEQSARLHHRAVYIHPFVNGNGRWSRLLANIWLRRHRRPIIEWPEGSMSETTEARRVYLHAVREADHGNLDPLIQFHRQYAAD